MRFVGMHKVNEHTYAGPPSPELMMSMGKLITEMHQAGKLVSTEGLKSSADRVRLRFSGGRRTIEKGPYAGTNELVACLMMLQVRTIDEAIEWSTRYAEAIGDVELELGPVTEPWDMGVMPRPADPPLRCLLLQKASPLSEAGTPLGPSTQAAVRKLLSEMEKRGVLLSSAALRPSREGARIRYAGGERRVIDGPFAESKELIAGFAILEVDSKEEAMAFTHRFAAAIGDVELDVMPVA